MPIYHIRYNDRDTLPDHLESLATSLELTPEELIKRFVEAGMRDHIGTSEPSTPGESLEDFFVKNGALKPK